MKSIFHLIILSSFIYITNSQVKLIHPNGGEVLWSGGRTEVLYEGAPDTNFVELMVTYDNGRNWDNITHDIYNGKWYIPQVQSDSCKLALNYFEDRGIINSATFGGSDGEGNSFILPATDSGYYLIGNSSSTDIESINKVDNIYMYKLNSRLEVEWIRAYGGSEYDKVKSVIRTDNNKIVLFGDSKSSDGDIEKNLGYYDIFIMQLDLNGNVEWSKSYGGSDRDYCATGISTQDGGFAIIGQTRSKDVTFKKNEGNHDVFLIKTNDIGEVEFVKMFATPKEDIATSLIETENGDLLLIAFSEGSFDSINNYGWNDAWIFRLNSNGEKLWTKNYGGKSHDLLHFIINDNNGGYILVGNSDSEVSEQYRDKNSSDIWVINITENGEVIESTTFGSTFLDYGLSVTKSNNGDIYILGSIVRGDGDFRYIIGDEDYLVMKLDTSLKVRWSKVFGGTKNEYPSSILISDNNSIVVSGQTQSNDVDITTKLSGYSDFWVVKFDGESDIIQTDTSDAYFTIVDPTQTNIKQNKTDEPTVSPNPTNGLVNLKLVCGSKLINYSITNTEGENLFKSKKIVYENRLQLDLSEYPSGVYFVTVVCGSDKWTYKVVRER